MIFFLFNCININFLSILNSVYADIFLKFLFACFYIEDII